MTDLSIGLNFAIFSINMLLIGIYYWASYYLHKTIVSPLSIFATFFLLISNLNLITSFDEAQLGIQGWMAIWIGVICFGMGYFFYLLSRPGWKSLDSFSKLSNLNRLLNLGKRKDYLFIVLILFFLSLAAFFSNLYRVFSIFGADVFFVGREYEIVFGMYTPINYLFFLNLLVIVLSTLGAYSHGSSTKLFTIILVISIFETIFTGNKSTFLFGIFFFVYSKLLITLKLNARIIFYLFLGTVTIFFLIHFLRGGLQDEVNFHLISGIFSSIESYTVYSYKNLENIIILQAEEGKSFPFYDYFLRFYDIFSGETKSLLNKSTGEYAASYLVNPDYNVRTYLGALYLSYGGYLGIIIGSLAAGLIAAMLYLRLYYRPTLIIFFINVVYMSILSVTFSEFEFFRPQFLYLIFISCLVSWSLKKG